MRNAWSIKEQISVDEKAVWIKRYVASSEVFQRIDSSAAQPSFAPFSRCKRFSKYFGCLAAARVEEGRHRVRFSTAPPAKISDSSRAPSRDARHCVANFSPPVNSTLLILRCTVTATMVPTPAVLPATRQSGGFALLQVGGSNACAKQGACAVWAPGHWDPKWAGVDCVSGMPSKATETPRERARLNSAYGAQTAAVDQGCKAPVYWWAVLLSAVFKGAAWVARQASSKV
eukprot:scaffold193_cov255-Pinguiococcus_pyrenoidosus.AAC.32